MKELDSYIDRCIIDEYATKDSDGLSLDLDNVSAQDVTNFLNRLMKNDTTVRDFVHFQMQQLINQRLPEVEQQDHWRRM